MRILLLVLLASCSELQVEYVGECALGSDYTCRAWHHAQYFDGFEDCLDQMNKMQKLAPEYSWRCIP